MPVPRRGYRFQGPSAVEKHEPWLRRAKTPDLDPARPDQPSASQDFLKHATGGFRHPSYVA